MGHAALAQTKGRPEAAVEVLAPRAGLEPATNRLTAGYSTIELPGSATRTAARAHPRTTINYRPGERRSFN